MTFIVANDGHIARDLPEWSREKLFYIESYLDIFCTAMKDKWSLVYADLLAGPGLSVDQATGRQEAGSPLLVEKRSEFRRLFFCDIDPRATSALSARIPEQPPGRVCVETMDCNQAVDSLRNFLFPPSLSSATLGLAVIDPTGFQITFDSLGRLTDGVKMDLIIIFMTGFARRFLRTPEFEGVLDQFFGTTQWRDLRKDREIGERVTYRSLLDLYKDQLQTLGYSYIIDDPRLANSRNSTIYHLVFASKHPRGADFFEKISRRKYNGQRRLF
jgi:three-Cys-motif partner protein